MQCHARLSFLVHCHAKIARLRLLRGDGLSMWHVLTMSGRNSRPARSLPHHCHRVPSSEQRCARGRQGQVSGEGLLTRSRMSGSIGGFCEAPWRAAFPIIRCTVCSRNTVMAAGSSAAGSNVSASLTCASNDVSRVRGRAGSGSGSRLCFASLTCAPNNISRVRFRSGSRSGSRSWLGLRLGSADCPAVDAEGYREGTSVAVAASGAVTGHAPSERDN